MARVDAPQLAFVVGPENTWHAPEPVGQPLPVETEHRISSLVTFSQIEKIIYRDIENVEPKDLFSSSAAVGAAIDQFLVPANFIYRYRADYCFPPELYPEWNLDEVFARYYPTGWGYQNILDLLKKHRANFTDRHNPLNPQNPNLERDNVKKRLLPLWTEVAKGFNLEGLSIQNVMAQENSALVASAKTASSETVAKIAQRVVTERFESLVDDDKDYTFIAKPDCLLVFEVDDQPTYLHIQPDFLKRQRERKSTAKRRIVTVRKIGDFKDSDKKDIANYSTAYGKTMLVYNWLLLQIGQKLKQNQLDWVKLASGHKRRVFVIPQEVKNPIPAGNVQTSLEFLQEEVGLLSYTMPTLSTKDQELAQSILEQAIRIARSPKF